MWQLVTTGFCVLLSGVRISSIDGSVLEVKDDLINKYLGSYISSTEKYIRVRKARTWRALHDFKNVCFRASVEPILVYGPEAWTLTMDQEAHLDGSVIHMHGLDGPELDMEGQDRERSPLGQPPTTDN